MNFHSVVCSSGVVVVLIYIYIYIYIYYISHRYYIYYILRLFKLVSKKEFVPPCE